MARARSDVPSLGPDREHSLAQGLIANLEYGRQ